MSKSRNDPPSESVPPLYAMQFIQGQGLEAIITELRRLHDRAGPESKMKAVSQGEHSGPDIEGQTLGEGVEVGSVVQSIQTLTSNSMSSSTTPPMLTKPALKGMSMGSMPM